MRIVINGKEVTNPVVRALFGMFALLVVGVIAALAIFLILPLVGIVVTVSVGLVGVLLVALGVGIPLMILGGTLIGALLTPFAVLRERSKRRELPGKPLLPASRSPHSQDGDLRLRIP
jgi:uncharacterized RDD family membrane protein YckC